jgi:hypothetical protein
MSVAAAPEVSTATKFPYRRRPRYVVGVLIPREIDLRSTYGWRFGRLIRGYVAELGGGVLSEQDQGALRRVCRLELRIEELQAEGGVDDEICRLSGEHRRLLKGLRSRAAKGKSSGQDDPLAEHLKAKYGARGDDAEGADTDDMAAAE